MADEAKQMKVETPKKYRVTIHSGEDKGDKGDVVLIHNFKQIMIQRDKEVVIDERYVGVLNDSVIHTVAKGEDGVERAIRIPRFSCTITPA
jgi:hypothetical protein